MDNCFSLESLLRIFLNINISYADIILQIYGIRSYMLLEIIRQYNRSTLCELFQKYLNFTICNVLKLLKHLQHNREFKEKIRSGNVKDIIKAATEIPVKSFDLVSKEYEIFPYFKNYIIELAERVGYKIEREEIKDWKDLKRLICKIISFLEKYRSKYRNNENVVIELQRIQSSIDKVKPEKAVIDPSNLKMNYEVLLEIKTCISREGEWNFADSIVYHTSLYGPWIFPIAIIDERGNIIGRSLISLGFYNGKDKRLCLTRISKIYSRGYIPDQIIDQILEDYSKENNLLFIKKGSICIPKGNLLTVMGDYIVHHSVKKSGNFICFEVSRQFYKTRI